MNTKPEPFTPSGLPISHNLRFSLYLSVVVGILMGAMSLAGLIFPKGLYPSEALAQSFMINDVINLLIGIPYLLVSIYLTRRGKLVGLLLWPGAMLYVFYNYAAYVVGMSLGWVLFVDLLLVLLSAYVFADLIKRIDREKVMTQLEGFIPRKTAGWFLLVFGVLFIIRAVGVMVQASIDQVPLPPADLGTSIADIFLSTVWVIGGVFLLQRKALGYVSGLGALFTAGLLFLGLILFLFLQPILTTAPFAPVDVLVIATMGAVCSIPAVLYLRAVQKA